ncbi:MAG: ferritin-like domain-containing protein [Gemmataceae bacterium]|nr:ferritin-like domain-containing protein [Gemmataceae bacterium]
MDSLRDLLVDQLQDLYSAEKQLVKALPQMASAAESDELRQGFEEHLVQTRNHVNRLERAFEKLGAALKENTCEAMEGLIEEGQEIMSQWGDSEVRDAGLIAAAQKVEHYEIASYGSVCAWADQLGQQEVAQLLHETLDEEKQTDEKLTHMAEQQINLHAIKG